MYGNDADPNENSQVNNDGLFKQMTKVYTNFICNKVYNDVDVLLE